MSEIAVFEHDDGDVLVILISEQAGMRVVYSRAMLTPDKAQELAETLMTWAATKSNEGQAQ